jgi:hypothetical protein
LTLNPVPVTENETVTGIFDPSLVIAKLPVALGVKLMLILWPPATLTGGAGWVTEGAIRDACLATEVVLASVTVALALLVVVAVKLLLVPTGTLPKLTAFLCSVVWFEGAALML